MSIFVPLLVLILAESAKGAPQEMNAQDVKVDSINIFLTMAWQVANHLRPHSSCYVCGLVPYTAGEGLPLMALPVSDCDTCHLLHIPLAQSYSHPECPSLSKMRPLNCSGGHASCDRCFQIPKPVPILLNPQPFPWCLENDGHRPIGESTCLRTFKWDPKHPVTDFPSVKVAPEQCLEAAGAARLSALAHRTASCSISSPAGMYWVCGGLAYPYLPMNYKGRCGLAYVVPAMRVTQSLPQKPLPRRAPRGVSDIFGTHHQSSFKNMFGSILPFYGVMSSLDQIADLSHAVEAIANATGKALLLMSNELASVRLLALQNRAALDFLLAARGGTCAVIGSECCTFIPDYNATIADIVSHLHTTANSVHQDSNSLLDWLRPAFGSYSIVQGFLILLVFCVLFSLFISCVKRFLFNMN